MKADNSFNYKAQKIKVKHESNNDSKNFFNCNAA